MNLKEFIKLKVVGGCIWTCDLRQTIHYETKKHLLMKYIHWAYSLMLRNGEFNLFENVQKKFIWIILGDKDQNNVEIIKIFFERFDLILYSYYK